VGAEFGTLLRHGDKPGVVPEGINTPRIRRRRASRVGLLATFVALAGALAAPTEAVPRPDPAPSVEPATEQPAPDPFPSSGSDRSRVSSPTPDQSTPTTSRGSPPAAEPRPTTPAPVSAPVVPEKLKRTTTRPDRDVQVVWPPPSRVRSLGPQATAPAVVTAVADPAEMRGLALGGLALLMLAAASGSLLFLLARGGVREARP
jgi:hypothetical protein